ncbi:MAG TPA: TetR/AcrR family transcriptional regulator C-terminal domain-containing protein [Kofleriaceae bacterium]|nr:TetR/AcrR family transcriptional regulator C-terminal domain-containing protein [Kofleriaceae bacterium]
MARGRREPLSRERILDAALALVDRDGIEGLSMRRLGEELGVEAMSLYNHVPNKEALLDGLHERILAEVAPAPATTRDWRAFARQQARSLHAALTAHPHAIALFATRPAATTSSLARLDSYLAVLRRAGFEPVDSLMVVQLVSALVVGHALWIAGTTAARTPVTVTPALAAAHEVARALDAYRPDQELEVGLEALLAGLEMRRRRPR